MKHLLLLFSLLFFVACGENSSEAEATSSQKEPVEMELGVTYILHEGDKIEKDDAKSIITISKNSKEDESYVTLVEGSAHIIYK